MRAVTIEADDNIVTCVLNHGYGVGERVVFKGLVGGTGLTEGTIYYVIAAGLTDKTFEVSTAAGGSAVNISVDYTAGYVRRYHAGGKAAAQRGLRGS